LSAFIWRNKPLAGGEPPPEAEDFSGLRRRKEAANLPSSCVLGTWAWVNLYPKLPISAILGAVSPQFKSDNGEIWREGTDLGHPTLRLIL